MTFARRSRLNRSRVGALVEQYIKRIEAYDGPVLNAVQAINRRVPALPSGSMRVLAGGPSRALTEGCGENCGGL
jgi:hypothetical protein